MKQGVGGAFIWSLEMDDFRGSCGNRKYPLLSAIAAVFNVQSQSPRRSSYSDFDEFSPGSTRRGAEGRSREVGGLPPGRDRDRDRTTTTRYRSSRGRDRPIYSDEDDYSDLDSPPTPTRDDRQHAGRSAAEPGLQHQPRRHQHSPGPDDVASGRSSRRRTPLTDDLSDIFRRHDDIDDNAHRPDRRRDPARDDVLSKRQGWSESTTNDHQKPFGRDGRRMPSQEPVGRAPPVAGWNDESRARSSTFVEEDSFASNRLVTGGVDRRNRLGSSRGRTADYDEPVDGMCRYCNQRCR